MSIRSDVLAGLLAVAAVVGIIVLAVLGQPCPDVLTYVAVGALGVQGGAMVPGAGSAKPTAVTAPPAPLPLPVPLAADPPTGVIMPVGGARGRVAG